jgi:hypothetical protein
MRARLRRLAVTLTVALLGGVLALGAATPAAAAEVDTVPVPGAPVGTPVYDMLEFDGVLYFTGGTDQLWAYDGTNDAYLVASGLGIVGELTLFDDELYFTASDGIDSRVYHYDGVNPPAIVAGSPIYPSDLEVFQNELVFTAQNAGFDLAFWIYDGTNPPVEVAGAPEAASQKIVYDGNLYFNALLVGVPLLWVWDGTNPPTVVVGPMNPGEFIEFDGDLYFRAHDGANDYPMWMFDGTNPPAEVAGSPLIVYDFAEVAGGLVFSAEAAVDDRGYFYDGVNPPALIPDSPLYPYDWTTIDGIAYLSYYDGSNYVLATFDGSSFTLYPSGPLRPYNFTPFQGKVFISVDVPELEGAQLAYLQFPVLLPATGPGDGRALFAGAALVLLVGTVLLAATVRRRATTGPALR